MPAVAKKLRRSNIIETRNAPPDFPEPVQRPFPAPRQAPL